MVVTWSTTLGHFASSIQRNGSSVRCVQDVEENGFLADLAENSTDRGLVGDDNNRESCEMGLARSLVLVG